MMEATTERTAALRHISRLRQFGAMLLIAVMFAAFACSRTPAPATQNTAPANAAPAPTVAPAPEQSRPVQTQMRNVFFHLSSSSVAHIETLTGEIVPTGSNVMPVLDDKTSFE